MAKAKITKNGNVQVTMAPEQWEVLNSIFQHVRLGTSNMATSAFSDLVVDLDSFNEENNFDGDSSAVETYMTYVGKRGNTKTLRSEESEFCIELGLVRCDQEE